MLQTHSMIPVRAVPEKLPSVVFATLCFIWGSTWLAIKVGLDFLPPFLFAGVRFAVASLFLVFLVPLLHARIPRDRSSWTVMLFLGIFQITLVYGLVFWGEQYVSSGLTAVLSATLPLFVVILAHISIKAEPITRRKALGVIVAFAGVTAIFWRDLASAQVSTMQFSLLGSLAIVGSAASGAAGNVVAKRYASGIDPSANVLIQSVVGAVSLLFVSIVTERGSVLKLVPTVIAAALYLGVVGSALAFVGWYWLLTKTTVTNSSLVLFVTPVVALVLGWLVLQEVVEPVVALGTFLILSGVYLTVKQGKVAS
jgi:drug/metabolite transporter (DMT)-like permease